MSRLPGRLSRKMPEAGCTRGCPHWAAWPPGLWPPRPSARRLCSEKNLAGWDLPQQAEGLKSFLFYSFTLGLKWTAACSHSAAAGTVRAVAVAGGAGRWRVSLGAQEPPRQGQRRLHVVLPRQLPLRRAVGLSQLAAPSPRTGGLRALVWNILGFLPPSRSQREATGRDRAEPLLAYHGSCHDLPTGAPLCWRLGTRPPLRYP